MGKGEQREGRRKQRDEAGKSREWCQPEKECVQNVFEGNNEEGTGQNNNATLPLSPSANLDIHPPIPAC